MKRIDVVKKPDGWAGTSGGRTVPNTKAATKVEAVKKVAAAAKKGSEPVWSGSTRRTGRSKRSAPTRAPRTRAQARARSQAHGPATGRGTPKPSASGRFVAALVKPDRVVQPTDLLEAAWPHR